MKKQKLKLKLERPLVFFDLESTGLNTSSDKIVSLSFFKIYPDGKTEGKNAILNPEMEIPEAASSIHGITNSIIQEKKCPTFKQIAKSLYAFIKDCDIIGFNNGYFDTPMLCEEFNRVGIDFPTGDVKMIDVCTIFKKMEQRTLAAAYKFYCNKDLENAHTSDADTLATYEVFIEQLERYDELKGKSLEELAEFCKFDNRVDLAGKIVKNENGEYLYNFGKHKNQKVIDNPSYAQWMLSSDFTSNTKTVLNKILIELGLMKEENPF